MKRQIFCSLMVLMIALLSGCFNNRDTIEQDRDYANQSEIISQEMVSEGERFDNDSEQTAKNEMETDAVESSFIESESSLSLEEPVSHAADHVYSHRGASGYEVEHTFAAYDLAIEQGSHYIEQDLVCSKDGTLYISHDETAERIAGVDRLYCEMSDDEIRQLRTANGEPIHTLQEVFDRYGASVNYLIELKGGDSQIESFAEIVRANDMENRVIVQYIAPQPLEKLEAIFPEMKKLLLCRKQDVLDIGVNCDYVDIICVKYTLLNQENCDKAHEHGKEFSVYWTIDAAEDIPFAIELGADTYFTNFTDVAMQLEQTYRK